MVKHGNPSILAAMAGITTGDYANKCLIDGGAGLVTIGGFPIGHDMIIASKEAIQHGRNEFILNHGEEALEVMKEALKISQNSKLIINLRFNRKQDSKQFVNSFSNLLSEKPIIEINAHCRQPEVTMKGGGQALLNRYKLLETIINIFKAKDFKVSLKFRGNAVSSEIFIPKLKSLNLDFVHIDSYREGEEGTDLKLLNKYSQKISTPIIGNNSVHDPKSAWAVLKTGAKYFSLARASQKNPLIFRKLIKKF